jgi:hypothetical protein
MGFEVEVIKATTIYILTIKRVTGLSHGKPVLVTRRSDELKPRKRLWPDHVGFEGRFGKTKRPAASWVSLVDFQ